MLSIIEITLSLLVLALAVLFGLVVERYTRDEIPNYKIFFKPGLWISAILAAIFYNLDLVIALTFTFIFIFIVTLAIKTSIKEPKKIKTNKSKNKARKK